MERWTVVQDICFIQLQLVSFLFLDISSPLFWSSSWSVCGQGGGEVRAIIESSLPRRGWRILKNNLVLEDGGVGKQKRSAMGCALDFLFSLFSRYIYFPSLSNFQCLILSQTVLRFENSYHLSTWGSWRQKFHRIPPQMWWFILLFLPKSIPS